MRKGEGRREGGDEDGGAKLERAARLAASKRADALGQLLGGAQTEAAPQCRASSSRGGGGGPLGLTGKGEAAGARGPEHEPNGAPPVS